MSIEPVNILLAVSGFTVGHLIGVIYDYVFNGLIREFWGIAKTVHFARKQLEFNLHMRQLMIDSMKKKQILEVAKKMDALTVDMMNKKIDLAA